MAITFAVWGASTKLAWMSFSCFTVSQVEGSFLPWVAGLFAYDCFLSSLSQELSLFTEKEHSPVCSSCGRHHLGALGIRGAKGPLAWGAPAAAAPAVGMTTQVASPWQTGGTCWTKGWVPSQAGWSWVTRDCHSTQNGTQFNAYGLFISGVCHLMFLYLGWPWVTTENITVGQGGLLYSL